MSDGQRRGDAGLGMGWDGMGWCSLRVEYERVKAVWGKGCSWVRKGWGWVREERGWVKLDVGRVKLERVKGWERRWGWMLASARFDGSLAASPMTAGRWMESIPSSGCRSTDIIEALRWMGNRSTLWYPHEWLYVLLWAVSNYSCTTFRYHHEQYFPWHLSMSMLLTFYLQLTWRQRKERKKKNNSRVAVISIFINNTKVLTALIMFLCSFNFIYGIFT